MISFEQALAQQKAKRKSPSNEEHRIQRSCVRWFNLSIESYKVASLQFQMEVNEMHAQLQYSKKRALWQVWQT